MVEEIFFIVLVSLAKEVIADMEGFIVGGERAKINDYPHSAFLEIDCKGPGAPNTYACGSSIVNQLILLTAAHCLEDCGQKTTIYVTAGHVHYRKGVERMAKSFKMHEQYNPQDSRNDVGLIMLRTAFELGTSVQRVVLMRNPPAEKFAALAGWGATSDTNPQDSYYLKHLNNLKVWSRASCIQALKIIPLGTFCAGEKWGKEYAAIGDSGSALMIRNYIQIGLVSFKLPSMSKSLIIYTDIGYFYDWISKRAKRLYCKNRYKNRMKQGFFLPDVSRC